LVILLLNVSFASDWTFKENLANIPKTITFTLTPTCLGTFTLQQQTSFPSKIIYLNLSILTFIENKENRSKNVLSLQKAKKKRNKRKRRKITITFISSYLDNIINCLKKFSDKITSFPLLTYKYSLNARLNCLYITRKSAASIWSIYDTRI
jgi:hypothetical protein